MSVARLLEKRGEKRDDRDEGEKQLPHRDGNANHRTHPRRLIHDPRVPVVEPLRIDCEGDPAYCNGSSFNSPRVAGGGRADRRATRTSGASLVLLARTRLGNTRCNGRRPVGRLRRKRFPPKTHDRVCAEKHGP